MDLQLIFYRFQNLVELNINDPFVFSSHHVASARKFLNFLNRFEEILHTVAGIIYARRNFPSNPQKEMDNKKENLRESLINLHKKFPRISEEFTFICSQIPGTTLGIFNFDYRDTGNIEKLVKDIDDFTPRDSFPPSSIDQSKVTALITSLFQAVEKQSVVYFESDAVTTRKQALLSTALPCDPILNGIFLDEEPNFKTECLKKITISDYELFKTYPITILFLMAGLTIIELDPPNLPKTIAYTQNLSIVSVIESAKSLKKNIGRDKFQAVLRTCYQKPEQNLERLPVIFNLINQIGGKDDGFFSKVLSLLESQSSWEVIMNQLSDFIETTLYNTGAAIPNQQVYHSYRTESRDIKPEFMVNQEDLAKAIATFEQIAALTATFFSLSDTEIQYYLNLNVATYKENPDSLGDFVAIIWGCLRETFRRFHKILLYSTQMINALLIMNAPSSKVMAQIKTGEGKSALQAIMMAFKALTTGCKQFNITTASLLAERDARKFKLFFEAVGLSCGVNVSTDPRLSHLFSDPKIYQQANIVYGTASSFEFAYLYSLTSGSNLKEVVKPENTYVWIDEADALIIDDLCPSQIQGKVLYDDMGLYYFIWDTVWRYYNETEEIISLTEFKAALVKKKFFTEETINQPQYLLTTYDWYLAAATAIYLERDIHYVVQNDSKNKRAQIVLVDKEGTGMLLHGRSWIGGLQGIISAREQLTYIPTEPNILALIYPNNFFNLFLAMYCFTGTSGGVSCQSYLEKSYPGIILYDLPRHKPSRATEGLNIISDNVDQKYEQLIKDIRLAKINGYPLLIIFSTIREVIEFKNYAATFDYNIATLIGMGEENSEDILAGAGLPGSVLAATFLAGRGADIITTPEAEANGGLLVLVCTPPANARVEMQNFGRTGRQGRNGKWALRLTQEDIFVVCNELDRSIQAKDKMLCLKCDDTLDLPPPPWQTEYKTDIGAAADAKLPSINKDKEDIAVQIKSFAQKKRAQFAEKTKSRLSTISDNQNLLTEWQKLRDIAETKRLECHIVCYSNYNEILFNLQKFVYATKNVDLILSLSNHYNFLFKFRDQAAKYQRLQAFKRIIGQTLQEMAQECHLQNLDTIAAEINNAVIIECLKIYADYSIAKKIQASNSNEFNSLFFHNPPAPHDPTVENPNRKRKDQNNDNDEGGNKDRPGLQFKQ